MITISFTKEEFDVLVDILRDRLEDDIEWDCPDDAKSAQGLIQKLEDCSPK